MTEIERQIDEYIQKKKECISQVRERIENGELILWKDAIVYQEGDYIQKNGVEYRIVSLYSSGFGWGFDMINYKLWNSLTNETIAGTLAINVPDNDDWIDDVYKNRKEVFDFIKENETKIRNFFDVNVDNPMYEFKTYDKSLEKSSHKVIEEEKEIFKLVYDFMMLSGKLYKYVPDNNGAFIRFIDKETIDRLDDIVFRNSFKGRCVYLNKPWWNENMNGLLAKINFIRFNDKFYDDFNADEHITGIDIQTQSWCQYNNWCMYGYNGYNFQPFPNPMQFAEIALLLMDKIKHDFTMN